SGFNVITGQNAAGKTALLELLGLNFPSRPHRSLQTVPNPGDVTDQRSVLHVDFTLSNAELTRILRNSGGTRNLPLPDLGSTAAREVGVQGWNDDAARRFIEWFFNKREYEIHLDYVNGAP